MKAATGVPINGIAQRGKESRGQPPTVGKQGKRETGKQSGERQAVCQ